MDAKVLDFVQRNGLVLGGGLVRRFITSKMVPFKSQNPKNPKPFGYVLNAPISTFPALIVLIGSITMATKGSWNCWLRACVLTSMPDSQQP
jgi:hypothetical protein